MSTPAPTGRREDRDGTPYVVFERTFRAPVEDVWAAVTEPARLQRWIGTWTGDPESGAVEFTMTAEGDDVAPEPFTIHACEPPRRLAVSSQVATEDGSVQLFHLALDLVRDGGVTTLTFAQSVSDAAMAESMGPGWDYYLDRLVAAESGGDVGSVDFDDYYPAHAGHYRSAFG